MTLPNEQQRPSEEFDIVVVGSGGGGLVAAITAAENGARVAVLERSAKFGGTTAYSGGKIWIPDNHHMRRCGIPDSREAAARYLLRVCGDDHPEMIDAYLQHAPEMAAYVEERTPLAFYPCVNYPDYHPTFEGATLGGRALDAVPFDASGLGEQLAHVRRSPTFLPFTHEEWEAWRWPADFDWTLIGERITSDVVTTGAAIVAALMQGCLERGVTLYRNTRGRRLLAEDLRPGIPPRPRVAGIEVDQNGERRQIQTRLGVLLACGGFDWNPDLQRRFLRGPVLGAASPPGNEGDGIAMGMEIGAQIGNMSEAWWAPLVQVPGESVDDQPLFRALINERGLPGSIIVNRQGGRFVDEAHNYNDITKTFHHFDPVAYAWPNLDAWLIFDAAFQHRYSVATIMPGEAVPEWVARADSPGVLAEKIGIDAAGLAATLARFNGFARAGVDLDFGRGGNAYDRYYGDPRVGPSPNLASLETPPFYAVKVLPGMLGTKGGLVTDADARVLDLHGDPIAGLYACGNTAAFWLGRGYPGPGASIGPAMTFGYLAARHAMGARSSGDEQACATGVGRTKHRAQCDA
jgi:succinate dehydrogenase/fumarate reductase flavoprotein subunit